MQVTAPPAALAAIGDDTIDRDAVAQHGAHGSGRDDRHAIAGPNRALDRQCRGFVPRPVHPWLSPAARCSSVTRNAAAAPSLWSRSVRTDRAPRGVTVPPTGHPGGGA